MLRRFIPVYLIIIIFLLPLKLCIQTAETTKRMDKVSLFFVDRQMMRLIECDYYITDTEPEKEANMIIDELLKGRDENDAVRRMLPDEPDAINVKVKDEIAYININEKYIDKYEKGRVQEFLIIYQLVNSVSSVDGISRVKFLFDGKEKRSFLGELDMREAFIPDYCI